MTGRFIEAGPLPPAALTRTLSRAPLKFDFLAVLLVIRIQAV
jgi:hypothetical protein